MKEREIYIYRIKKGKVVKEVCICTPKGESYYWITGHNRARQSIHKDSLDICERNRVVSFTDDLPRFEQIIIKDLEARIEETKKRLAQQETTLKQLKEEMNT